MDIGAAPAIEDFKAFGSALEENKLSSHELMIDMSSLQGRVSSLLDAHSEALGELGALRAECSRVTSLLEYEGNARRKFEQDSIRLAAEGKEMRSSNGQLRVEVKAVHDELVKLESQHDLTCKEFTIVETRLLDVERELSERAGQYDHASALLKRTQQELDQRNREYAATRQKLEMEATAHQLLAETTRRESGVHTRELARLNEEGSQLRNSLAQQEALARNFQMNAANLKQEVALIDERYRRLEEELAGLQASSALEAAQLTTKMEATNSKADLVEKLLMTANGRNRMTDEELQTSRAELKRVRSDLATTASRAERFEAELTRTRATGMESEAARRELAAQCNELTIRLKDAEDLRARRDREADTRRYDMDIRAESDRQQVDQLRTSLEIAKAEIRQLRAERAILTGQLEVARGDRSTGGATETAPLPDPQNHPVGHLMDAQPLIEISERSLRGSATNFGLGVEDDSFAGIKMPRIPPAE